MDYPFENLDPEKFQLFCQALLTNEFPNVQCMPVAQPDGGRDAVHYVSGKEDFYVFQVKYNRNPHLETDPHKWLMEIAAEEAPKLAKLIPLGAKKYFLLTNVPGTAHLDVGSIDKLNKALTDTLGIPSVCWWRNDLDRRLDNNWNLKWSYPELMTGPDLIRAIIESGLTEDKERRSSIIKAFIANQYSNEEDVKFKQVDLQNKLLDLFIDVPLSVRWRGNQLTLTDYEVLDFDESLNPFESGFRQEFRSSEDKYIGAASYLLSAETQAQHPYIVLEGAPGQGKSTITQYICQVHRMRILNKAADQELISAGNFRAPIRVPVKVDLRDYALWLERKDPFSANTDQLSSDHWSRNLEAFLAALINHSSGGADFNVTDLHAISRLSSLLLVLDGLDEVADIRRRNDVVEEIDKCVNRLESVAASLQVIVTSRPTAFANSPSLPEKRFDFLSLQALTPELINTYAEKWLKARRTQERESAEIKRVLKEKLSQSHIKDLARNAMQLAILLSLISTRGQSLPDKRTALYDAYMDLFFSREAEKSTIVRDNRDLLIDIHRYLAWLLHSSIETEEDKPASRQSGSITSDALVKTLRAYLESEGRDPNLAEMLFTGIAERVMALVSRIQGTYEFEVQPLREYFAARFLFETAPYSPTGNEKKGTRPDRFNAISRNFYWLNVCRFYAGCYSKGELSSLVELLNELTKDPDFHHLSHPRILSATLLSDWVFSQNPKSVIQVMDLILDDIGLRFVLASNSRRIRNTQPLILPHECGRPQLIDKCFSLLASRPAADMALDIFDLLKANGVSEDLLPKWYDLTNKSSEHDRSYWLACGVQLGCLPKLSNDKIVELSNGLLEDISVVESLLKARQFGPLTASTHRLQFSLQSIFDRYCRVPTTLKLQNPLDIAIFITDISRYAISFLAPENIPLSELWRKRLGRRPTEFPVGNIASCDESISDKSQRVIGVVANEVKKESITWARSLVPWDTIVEAIRKDFGDSWSTYSIANVAAGIKSSTETCTDNNILFENSHSLCRRARYARLRAGAPAWWSQQFKQAKTKEETMFSLLLWVTWASPTTLSQNVREIDELISALEASDWYRLFDAAEEAVNLTDEQSGDRRAFITWSNELSSVSAMTATLLYLRAGPKSALEIYSKKLAAYLGDDRCICKVVQSQAIRTILSEKVDWTRELSAIKNSYLNGTTTEYGIGYERRHFYYGFRVPLEAANRICEDANHYPSFLIAAAENACRVDTSKRIKPVAAAAKAGNWLIA